MCRIGRTEKIVQTNHYPTYSAYYIPKNAAGVPEDYTLNLLHIDQWLRAGS